MSAFVQCLLGWKFLLKRFEHLDVFRLIRLTAVSHASHARDTEENVFLLSGEFFGQNLFQDEESCPVNKYQRKKYNSFVTSGFQLPLFFQYIIRRYCRIYSYVQ